jgi:tRNA1(Val) A37 N6-methylase TrmN6
MNTVETIPLSEQFIMMDLTAQYKRGDFLSFLSNSFLPDDFERVEEKVTPEKSASYIKNTVKLGSCPSLDLSVYEFSHGSRRDPRVSLTREAFSILKRYDNTASSALAVFHNEDSAAWRLSLITSEYSLGKTGKQAKRGFSNPRRFSWLLGAGCKRHTPEKFLVKDGTIREQTRNGKKFTAIEDLKYRFSVEALTKEFYDKLYNWYEWALPLVRFPEGTNRNVKLTDMDNEMHLIRLITRIIFVWFIKQKRLVPEWIFNETEIASILKRFQPQSEKSGDYYNGILQNLFFATLNKEINERAFTKDESEYGNDQFGINTYYRDRKEDSYFTISHDEFIGRFKTVPFLNGGLFECLDKRRKNPKKAGFSLQEYHDGFSREKGRCAFVPDALFFGKDEDGGREGLINLFNRYNFTVEENTPVDVEVALDPELLGKVFENLLGYYNEETRTTARKESGSFYTPREIVDYMVTESLKAYLQTAQPPDDMPRNDDIDALFSYSDAPLVLNDGQRKELVKKIDKIKILDPACGSGAFPMGALNKLSLALFKLDSNGKLWKERQEERAREDAAAAFTIDDQRARDAKLKEISDIFEFNKSEYGHKLYLIQNCMFGVDVQPIAIQIAKLRFFISLIVEQDRDESKPNFGIRALPNLETKFVAANTLIGLAEKNKELLGLENENVRAMKKELWDIRERHFYAENAKKKNALRDEDEKKRGEIKQYLLDNAAKPNFDLIRTYTADIARLESERKEVEKERFVDVSKDNRHLFEDLNDGLPLYVDQNADKRARIDAGIEILKTGIEAENSKLADESLIKSLNDDIQKIAGWNPYDQSAKAAQFFDPYWMFGISNGFDVVIGNPPYVEHKKLRELSALIKNDYQVYSGTADLSVYFIEKGIKLCKNRGYLSYITTNKFFNTIYGQPVREFLLNYQLKICVNFEQVAVFENTLVSTVIISIAKQDKYTDDFIYKKYYNLSHQEFINQFTADIVNEFGRYKQSVLNSNEWSFSDNEQLQLKSKIENAGMRICSMEGVAVFRGVTTGYNPAFIVDRFTKEALIALNIKNKEIIKPMLQGRNIRKWVYVESDGYLIFTKQGINIKLYPAIQEHLKQFYSDLKPRRIGEIGNGRKPGTYKWYEIQDNTAYYPEFEKEKIIWGLTADKWAFAYDNKKHYLPSNGYILTSKKIPVKYLLALLNSNLLKYYFGFIGVMTAGGAYTLKHGTIQALPVKIARDCQPFIDIVDNILAAKAKNPKADTSALEGEIDDIVYSLYGLTEDEIKIVERDV